MNVDYNKHNIVKYLANNKDKDIWKMSVSSIGFQSTNWEHAFECLFKTDWNRCLADNSNIVSTDAATVAFDHLQCMFERGLVGLV